MITNRFLTSDDLPLLKESLEKDEYHSNTPVEFFCANGSVCTVYEDDSSPVMFVRGCKSLRLDIQFLDNNDHKRNLKAMIEGFDSFVKQAKANGFNEIVFNSSSPTLVAFCKRRLGFKEVSGELRKVLL